LQLETRERVQTNEGTRAAVRATVHGASLCDDRHLLRRAAAAAPGAPPLWPALADLVLEGNVRELLIDHEQLLRYYGIYNVYWNSYFVAK
jgi:hypothetical protein